MRGFTRIGPTLVCKYHTRVEMTHGDKHSNYNAELITVVKEFYGTGPCITTLERNDLRKQQHSLETYLVKLLLLLNGRTLYCSYLQKRFVLKMKLTLTVYIYIK